MRFGRKSQGLTHKSLLAFFRKKLYVCSGEDETIMDEEFFKNIERLLKLEQESLEINSQLLLELMDRGVCDIDQMDRIADRLCMIQCADLQELGKTCTESTSIIWPLLMWPRRRNDAMTWNMI